MSEQVTVSELPSCDFCSMESKKVEAEYDFKTNRGPWANGCERHWKMHRASPALGTGIGQKLVVR